MPTITLFSEDRQARVKIERAAYESYDLSQQLSVSVVQGSFHGMVHIWIGELELQRFVKQLQQCEEHRQGEAQLEAMSPQDFSFRIFNTRAKGDFALAYEIGKVTSDSSANLKGGFSIDPSLLPQILSEFESFLTP